MKPRCLAPVRGNENRPCWRPRGHKGRNHASRQVYLRQLEQNQARRSKSSRKLRPCGSEAAYRRHLRAREVPCEPCRQAANAASAGYRAAWLARMTVPPDRMKT